MKGPIIMRAIISEKAYKNMDHAIYTFLVGKMATKKDVAVALKKQFSVDAVKVNMTKIVGKKKRVNKTRKFVEVGSGKKATVWLKSGQTIDALSTKTEKPKNEKKADKPKDSKEKAKDKKDE